MSRFTVTNEDNSWYGQSGEFVRTEETPLNAVAEDGTALVSTKSVLRMPGDRLVEFDPAELTADGEDEEAPAPSKGK